MFKKIASLTCMICGLTVAAAFCEETKDEVVVPAEQAAETIVKDKAPADVEAEKDVNSDEESK